MPSYATLAYFYLFPSTAQIAHFDIVWRLLFVIGVATIVLPLISVFIMLRFGKISSIHMEDQRERNWPLLQTAIIYAAAFYVLKDKAPVFLPLFILGAIISMVIAMVINLRWKISLHMIGVGGFCGGIVALFVISQEGNPIHLALTFALAGLLGTARLWLKAHTPLQILAGFALGFTVETVLALMVAGS